MEKFKIFFILFLISMIFILSCSDKSDMLTNETNSNREIDGVTGGTPNGGDLKSAEEGPIRSTFGQPVFELDTFKLRITGMIDPSFSLTWGEIQKLPVVKTDTLIMYCIEGWAVWGVWKGILVEDLLDKTFLYPDAEYLLFESIDGYKSTMSISYIKKYKTILAYEVNNNPLRDHDGYPLRLIAFGKFGYKWAKWVNKITVLSIADLVNTTSSEWLDPGDVPIEHRKYYEGEDVEPLEY